MSKYINVVTLGGGTGNSNLAESLKNDSRIRLSVICGNTDYGGNTQQLALEYGTSQCAGDATKCMVALSKDDTLKSILSARFKGGSYHNASLKNLFFALTELQTKDPVQALDILGRFLHIAPHEVVPVSKKGSHIKALLANGTTITGEGLIDLMASHELYDQSVHGIKSVWLAPHVSVSTRARQAIARAHYILIAPGDLYTSIAPVLLTQGVASAIQKSKAKIIMVLNIMTKAGETDTFSAENFIEVVELYLGRHIDVLIANNAKIPKRILGDYKREQKVVINNLHDVQAKVVAGKLWKLNEKKRIAHNPEALGILLSKVIQ